MTQATIYHNPRCFKSRETLQLLESKNISPEIILYLQNPLSKKELEGIISKLEIEAKDLLRTGEKDYKELVSKEGKPNNKIALDWMVQVPKLMERPIVVTGKGARIGRPPENVEDIL